MLEEVKFPWACKNTPETNVKEAIFYKTICSIAQRLLPA